MLVLFQAEVPPQSSNGVVLCASRHSARTPSPGRRSSVTTLWMISPAGTDKRPFNCCGRLSTNHAANRTWLVPSKQNFCAPQVQAATMCVSMHVALCSKGQKGAVAGCALAAPGPVARTVVQACEGRDARDHLPQDDSKAVHVSSGRQLAGNQQLQAQGHI